jgi:hypothetical protein
MNRLIPPDALEAAMRRRGVGAARIERVMRLNPNGVEQGSLPRGLGQPARRNWGMWQIGKGRFIRHFGRAAWDGLPPICKGKQGKRAYVSEEAVTDRAWEFPSDHPARRAVRDRRGNWQWPSNDNPAR